MSAAGRATYSTIELVTGSLIEVSHSPSEIEGLIQEPDGMKMLALDRMARRPSRKDTDYRTGVYIRASEIVAIYPLDEVPYDNTIRAEQRVNVEQMTQEEWDAQHSQPPSIWQRLFGK